MPTSPPSPSAPARFWHASERASVAEKPWPEAFHPDALCLLLNFHGHARLGFPTGPHAEVPPRTLSFSRSASRCVRTLTRDRHECLTLVFPDAWLSDHLRDLLPQLPATVRTMVSQSAPFFHLLRSITDDDLTWARSLMAAHLCEAARRLLDEARLTDFLVRQLLSIPSESVAPSSEVRGIVSRAERAARERVERVKQRILSQLDETHDLDSLAAAAGCSPHYLSRTFTQVTGSPLMLWIRRARIDRAADLIASGRCNVSEAALEVGYRSFSHFSRAFQEEKKVSPSKWVRHLVEARSPAASVPRTPPSTPRSSKKKQP